MIKKWNDLFCESKNILLDGHSNFEGMTALNEIINILFLKYGEIKKKYPSKFYINNVYKKYCEKYDKLKDKNNINKRIDNQITNLFHFVYKFDTHSIISQYMDTYKVFLNTNFTINHKYDLANLIINMYHTFKQIDNFTFDNTTNEYVYRYIKKYNPKLFLPDYIINVVITEIEPKDDEFGSDENCGVGDFLIGAQKYMSKNNEIKTFKNFSGYVYDENIYKFTIFNLLCNNIDFDKVKYGSFLNEVNYDQGKETCDYSFGYCCLDNDIPHNIKFELSTKNNIALQIQMCLHKLKMGGRCGLIIPQTVLYNNGVNKNSPSLEKTLMLTWEYKIRKMLLDNNNLYKIIFFPDTNLAGIFFVKGGKTKVVEFVNYKSENDIIKINSERIRENNYCLMINTYEKSIEINTIEELKKMNLRQSKVLSCTIDNKIHNRLNYRNILHTIYFKIGERKKIKKHTHLNIELGGKNICMGKGYKYIDELDFSIQGTDAKMTLEEIWHQCKINKINLDLKIKLNDGTTVMIKNQ